MHEKLGLGIKHGVDTALPRALQRVAIGASPPKTRSGPDYFYLGSSVELGAAKARLGRTTSRADLINPHIADGIIFNTAAQHEYQLASSFQAILFWCAGPQTNLRTVLRENLPRYTRIL